MLSEYKMEIQTGQGTKAFCEPSRLRSDLLSSFTLTGIGVLIPERSHIWGPKPRENSFASWFPEAAAPGVSQPTEVLWNWEGLGP